MTAENTEMFWVSTPERAAELIFRGIQAKRRVVYVTRRWRFVAWAMRLLPYHVYRRLMPKR
jgi:short-subunit dehydrogenase